MPRLEVRNLSMQFPAVRALDGVSLTFEPGEVHGIIGENGAGKSTLMKILAGLQQATEGEVLLDGNAVVFGDVGQALDSGIAMIHQELNLVDTLSVAENIFLGREPSKLGILNRSAMIAQSSALLEKVGSKIDPRIEVGLLPLAQKQLVEIAKALSYDASIIIMDEPTAVLTDQETESLFALIGDLQSQGVTVIYISHRLVEVDRLCDRITVLRDGKHVRTLGRGEATDAEMANLMVGREMGDFFPPKTDPPMTGALLEVTALSDGSRVHEVTLSLRPGEIVGMAGLIGSGRTEFAETLVGLRKATFGTVKLDGKPVSFNSPKQAAAKGLAYVSEDRKDAGLVLNMDVVENTTLANLGSYAKPLISRKAERESCENWIKKLDTRAGNIFAPILFLSGGNQQKVAVAKWLDTKPKVLILDEPTRGVDVGAKRELYVLIQELAKDGLACLVISSELPELLGLCHRVLVMREGSIVGELAGEAMTEEAIMQLAAGVGAA